MGGGKNPHKGKGRDRTADADQDDKTQKDAGPILSNLAAIIAAVSTIATGLGVFTAMWDLPFSLRMWGIGGFWSLAILAVLWKIGDSLKAGKFAPERKRVLAGGLALFGGVVLSLVLVLAMDFKSVQFTQQPSSQDSGLLKFRAAYSPASVKVSISVKQDATLQLRISKASPGQVQFLNTRSYGSDVLLTDFGDREEVVLSYQVQSPSGPVPAILLEGYPEKEGTGWLSAETVGRKVWWFVGAGVGICIVGFLLLSSRSF